MDLVPPKPLPQVSRVLRSTWDGHSVLILVCLITAAAAILRLWQLDAFPSGLHGDEGWTGIDARRIQSEGWIGPYVPSAIGQPTGPLYWAAAVLTLTGHGIFEVRFSMALLGIFAIPAIYFAARHMFDVTTAVIAAALLATMTWHLHFSRTGFMVISWPLMELLFIGLLFLAIKREQTRMFGLAGLVLGLGIYSYNVFPLFIIVAGVFAGLLVLQVARRRLDLLGNLAVLFACSMLTALPLLLFVAGDNDYFGHHRGYSVLHSAQYKAADTGGKIDILLDNAEDWLAGMLWKDRIDFVDGAGVRPMIDPLTGVLAALGIVVSLRYIKRPASQLLLLMLLLLPIAAIVSVEGAYRRTLGLAPVVAMLAAVPLALLWDHAQHRKRREVAMAMRAAVVLLIAAFAFVNVRGYVELVNADSTHWVFVRDFTAATRYMTSVEGEPYVYMLSSRTSFNYEIRRYLAPDIQGEDRSREFGRRQGFDVIPDRDSLFILLQQYRHDLPELEQRHPGGEVHLGMVEGEVLFIAYHVPAVPSTQTP